MSSEIENLSKVKSWYLENAKPFLLKLQPEKVADFDKDLANLMAKAEKIPKDFSACVLGNSGVGKSTLINSIVDGTTTVLPSGGIGPLTAQALTVKHSHEPKFEVEYHLLGNFWRLLFGFEKAYQSELRDKDSIFTPLNPEAEETEVPSPSRSSAISEEAAENRLERRKTIQLMITGNQDKETPIHYLVDCMRQVSGRPRIMGTIVDEGDAARIKRITEALKFAKQKISKNFAVVDSKKGEFLEELRYHASGFLAPLIKNLTVYWPSEVLQNGVTLVDLPGVGISGDVYREVTRKWIREKSQAIVLVVDHRGITDAVAQLLRSSEFLTRLIYTADDPIEDPVLVVAVTKIDDIAHSARDDEKQKLAGQGIKPKPLRDHFLFECTKAISMIKSQVRQQLESMASTDPEIGSTQRQVIENILNTLQVFPVSALQYRKFLANDEEDQSFINSEEQSNIPAIQVSLQNLAKKRKSDALSNLDENRQLFLTRTSALVGIIREKWVEETRAKEEAEELREKLRIFMEPLRTTLAIRQGEFRGFLNNAIPTRIEDLVAAALLQAEKEITAYLTKLKDAHWGTLKASVKRRGVFNGATAIDLPREFAFRIEEPIADAWGKKILKDIRTKTKEYGENCLTLVKQIVEWAMKQGNRVPVKLVQAQYESIKTDVTKLNSVGKDLIAELRDKVKTQLIETIEPPLRAGCEAFVEKNDHIGTGVKNRILELYSLMAKEVPDIVKEDAKNILTTLFIEVRKEILSVFENHQDPLQDAANAIVATREEYLNRSNSQRKKAVLLEGKSVMEKYHAIGISS